MAAEAVYLPNNVQISAVFKTTDRTIVIPTDTGNRDHRVKRESYPRRSFQIGWNKAEVPQVESMFNVFGRHTAFLVFLPRSENHTATAQTIGTGDGAKTVFQLSIKTTQGSKSIVRDILHPKTGTVLITVGGTAQTETTDYTVNYSTGVVTFLTAPASGIIAATFDYYTAFYFDSDELSVTIKRVVNSPLQEIGSLTIKEAPSE